MDNEDQQASQHQWERYEFAKKERRALQRSGVPLVETYEQFISRITHELGV
ncbi:hypothetical protein [Vreelandella andesensis]|uniref:hypothetical protein n=1 Tax=Vreelandella andesensis TaxID=447567 RepID=UPI00142E7E60|nr:hypothetical protein [Halomonas andesensis]